MARKKETKYSVVVDGVGVAYSGNDEKKAHAMFESRMRESRYGIVIGSNTDDVGHMYNGGHRVTLLDKEGFVVKEFPGVRRALNEGTKQPLILEVVRRYHFNGPAGMDPSVLEDALMDIDPESVIYRFVQESIPE